MSISDLKSKLSNVQWFLDYDGSMCPHRERWEEKDYSVEGVMKALNNLKVKSHSVFWNTGREVESLESVYPEYIQTPGYFVHGAVYWDTKKKEYLSPEPDSVLFAKVENFIKPIDGLVFSRKERALRMSSKKGIGRSGFEKYIIELNLKVPQGWAWRVGDKGAELLFLDCDKSNALKREYVEGCVPVVIGDDYFDKSAAEFALSKNGYVFLVGENCGWISETKHQMSQIIYCDTPADFLKYVEML